jgi:hypothetical protein
MRLFSQIVQKLSVKRKFLHIFKLDFLEAQIENRPRTIVRKNIEFDFVQFLDPKLFWISR